MKTIRRRKGVGQIDLKMMKSNLLFSSVLSVLGIAFLGWGLSQAASLSSPLTFTLLILLAVFAQGMMAIFFVGPATVSVASAISLATASLFGAAAGALAAAAAEIGLWIYHIYSHREEERNWKSLLGQLGICMGKSSTAVFIAGSIYHITLEFLTSEPLLSQTLPWLAAALAAYQVEQWLTTTDRWPTQGKTKAGSWQENKWKFILNVLVLSIGGGLLATAVHQFDLLGIAVFFLPIVLSAYSFRLYVNQTRRQMETLEEQVESRTKDLAVANKDLAALNRDKDAFLAVLTHDMRTPLTSIKGYASILRDRDLKREQQTHISKIILRSEENLLEIVNNILDIEKLQSGAPITLEQTEFDLALLVKAAIESLESLAMEKTLTLDYDDVPSPVMVTADEKKIFRVVTNLISNAIKYTPEEGKIMIRTFLKGNEAIVEVSDNGYGIPEDELPHIFDRFRRVKRHQQVAVGTGLGLAIVKSLIDAHRGEILVTSQVDVGSTFSVKLPR